VHCQPERPFEVDADRLVEEFLGDRVQVLVERGHTGVVDQHVEPPEVLQGACDELVAVVPVGDVARYPDGFRAGRRA
jgi:hypothetical protein